MSTAKALQTISQAGYLDMESVAVQKHEYVDGEVLAMAGASVAHNRIVRNALSAIDIFLANDRCEVFPSDLKVHVKTESAFVYPDLTIICNGPQFLEGRNDIITNPSVIIEVLSEATSDYDHGKKFMLYRQIPTFKEYLLISSTDMMLEHFVKETNSSWILTEYMKPDDLIQIKEIGFEVRLEALYRGVDLSRA